MDWKKTFLAAVAITGVTGIAVSASAQTPPAGCEGRPGMMRSHMRDMAADPAAFAERRLARLKADLRITDQQAPLWQDFADRARSEAGKGMMAMQNQAQDLSLSAPERMSRTADILRQRLAGMEAVNDSFRRLYDSLSAEQKRVADIHATRMGHGRHGGRGMAGPGGKGGAADSDGGGAWPWPPFARIAAMSSQVLARKWRPKSFATLVGQEHVVRALSHALDQQRLHHAYLFTGTRGVGKTTLARIVAKALNCETGVSSTPCGECSSCREIDSGRFVDYIELDAASNRGVDDMTGLLEKATYAPTRGRYKVYVIDEVHQLSGHAFNAMLKTLEEPPEHVKFILATTDPQKIPVTVLSRCLQFNLKQMPPAQIVDHLARVLAAEEIPFEAGALSQLARAAAGSMRDALSLLDQAIAHGAGRIEEGPVRDMLGTVSDDFLFAILDGLAAGDIQAMIDVADAMEARSLAFAAALQDLATLFHRIALVQFAPQAVVDAGERERLLAYAARFDAEFLQLCYQIAIHGRDDLRLAPDDYAGFTMTLLRLHAFRPDAEGSARTAPSRAASAPASAPPISRPTAPPRVTPVAAAAPASVPSVAPAAAGGDWHGMAASLPLSGLPKQLAHHCELASLDETQITLRLPPAHRSLLNTRAPQEKLQAELQNHLGRPVKLNIVVEEVEGETPAERSHSEKRERQERAIAAIEGDAFVRDVVDLFDASIDESTIKPV